MNEQKNNGRGIFYGVIGVATLVVAIIGATFAYFTATQSNNNTITGNMATIQFGLNVTKVTHVDETKGGMIPMSNNMVDAAVTNPADDGGTCVDNNGNAVCQIYKIVATNTGSASLFLDGYVSLVGGSGTPTDDTSATNKTTMRWAQVFCTGSEEDEITGCSTAGSTTTGAFKESTGTTAMDSFASLAATSDTTGFNKDNIKTAFADVTGKGYISGNEYDIINKNYIRISDHADGTAYTRTDDTTSALVFNQYLDATGGTTDDVTYYIVVWLSETGKDQTAGATPNGETEANPAALNFFTGKVAFNSAQGSEVTATFNGYTAVKSDQVSTGA